MTSLKNFKKEEPPRIARWLLRRLSTYVETFSIIDDFEDEFDFLLLEKGHGRARFWYRFQTIQAFRFYLILIFKWSFIMFRNYLKIAFRNLRKHKGFSFVNIAGLALGMACCTLISISVLDEIFYNTFHEKTDEIYFVGNYQSFEGNTWYVNATPALLGPALEAEFPEVTAATRFTNFNRSLVRYEDKSFFENRIYLVDPAFLDIFTFPLISGDKNTALDDPHSIVISENMAQKYFPGENPMGRTININNEDDFIVTGVIKNVPHNSTLVFEMLVNFKFREDQYRKVGRTFSWRSNIPRTLILLQDQSMGDTFKSKIKDFVREKTGSPDAPEFTIIPLKKYRFSPFNGGAQRTKTLSIYSMIAFIILLIACINFMNLSTARSANRAKEIGLRKVVGASRRNVIFQFLGESLFLSFTASVFAVLMVIILMPVFNTMFAKNLPLSILGNGYVLLVLLGIPLITGIIGGSYPAFFLSSFKPATTLKGDLRSGSKSVFLRKSLVVIQFVLSISLIICTVVIYRQIDFIKNKDMGFEKDHIMYIPLPPETLKTYPALKNSLASNSGIVGITGASHKPTSIFSNTTRYKWEGKEESYIKLIHMTYVDYNYTETMKIELVEGRDFSRQFPSDIKNSYIINETLMKDMGKDFVVGSSLSSGEDQGNIIGVVKDFHFIPLNDQIPPLVISLEPKSPRFLMVRILPNNISNTMSFIQETWQSLNPAFPFEYNFFDVEFESLYRVEERTANIIKSFAVLGIVIACLGLFGLASFTAEQRTKEIGIRKVLGASVPSVVKLVSKEFIFLVTASNLVAWPVSYIVMNNWLKNFAYKTNIDVWMLIVPSAIALGVTLLTVSFQAFKAAKSDPVVALKYE